MNQWQEQLAQFQKDCAQAITISHENLRKLMKDNQDTDYGRRYQFSGIQDVLSYQKQVPISDYADYAEAVKQMIEGDTQILTAYPVKNFILSSGSTGQQKRIPLTKEALKRCIFPIYYAAYACVPGIDQGCYLHMSVFRMEPPKEEPYTILSAAYFRELYDQGIFSLEERYAGGEALLFSKGVGDVPYVKLWIALSTPQLTGIQAFFLYDILLFLRYFEEHWKEVLDHVSKRQIPDDLPLSDEVKKALLGLPVLEPAWAERIQAECSKSFEGILPRLWEQMQYVSGVGGSTFLAQEPMLRFYLGQVPIHYFTYAASECMIGITTEMESVQNVLMPRSGFFEFLPYEKENDHRPRCIEELEVGSYYEVLVTNFSGFYRYRLNDVIKVTGFYGQAPIFEVCFRKNQAINIAGEKMDLQTLSKAIGLLARQTGIQILEYSVYDEKALLPGRYQCFIETSEELKGELGPLFDQILMKLNEDYQDLRGLGLVGMPVVSRVPAGTHLLCKKQFMAKQSQQKPLQYLSDPQIVAYMKERIL